MQEFNKRLAMLVSGSVLTAAGLYGAVQADAHSATPPAPMNATTTHTMQRPPLPWWMKRPCPTEDSYNCYWNDGGGRAFYVRRMPHTNRLCYLYAAGSDPYTDQCIRRASGL